MKEARADLFAGLVLLSTAIGILAAALPELLHADELTRNVIIGPWALAAYFGVTIIMQSLKDLRRAAAGADKTAPKPGVSL